MLLNRKLDQGAWASQKISKDLFVCSIYWSKHLDCGNFNSIDMYGSMIYIFEVKFLLEQHELFLELTLETYVWKILECFNMHKAKLIDTPFIINNLIQVRYPKTLEKE